MLGERFVLRCGAMVLGLVASAAWAAPDAQQRMFDRLQEQERERQQQQLEEMQAEYDTPLVAYQKPQISAQIKPGQDNPVSRGENQGKKSISWEERSV